MSYKISSQVAIGLVTLWCRMASIPPKVNIVFQEVDVEIA